MRRGWQHLCTSCGAPAHTQWWRYLCAVSGHLCARKARSLEYRLASRDATSDLAPLLSMSEVLPPMLAYWLARARCSLQRWSIAWPEQGTYPNIGAVPGPGKVVTPTLDCCWSKWGVSLQCWSSAWPCWHARSNIGVVPGLDGMLAPTLQHCLQGRCLSQCWTT